jgi:predicted RecB family nuclease
MRNLSKSKIIAYRQCPKRLWLEIHKPELRDDSASEVVFAIGNQVGELAQEIYNTDGTGVLIDINELGWPEAFAQSEQLLKDGSSIVFEAAMQANGALALADVMTPNNDSGKLHWDMIEVKSSTSVKDYHRDDVAIQSYIATSTGVKLSSAALAHVDNTFVYKGDGNYLGLLTEADLTEEATSRHDEVKQWLGDAQQTAALETEPDICTGGHCSSPFNCPFIDHCQSQEPQPEVSFSCLPNFKTNKKERLAAEGITELKDVPDVMLNDKQSLVKQHTLAGTTYFDDAGAASELSQATVPGAPHYFLDFETTNSAIPIWKGTRPYQQVPFQFSLHTLQTSGTLEQETFLDLSGDDPRRGFAEALIKLCGQQGPIFVYNAGFEKGVIKKQAEAFPDLNVKLEGIIDRIVDLLPIARNYYYHPSQQGSWSIKAVLPAVCPDLTYSDLDGVQDGNAAISAYQEAINPDTTPERKAEIHDQLEKYCALDTLAMVRLREFFVGK